MIKLVVLDFDDTLCLTEEACFKIENRIAEKMGHPPMTREVHQKNWGVPLRRAIAERIPGIDVDEFMRIITIVIPEYVKSGEMDKISDVNISVLNALREKGIRLAILTSRQFEEMEHILDESHHIHQLIEKIYHGGNLEFHKPDPRAFDKVLVDFGVRPDEVVYVGDSVTDGLAAKGAGLHFIAVLESGLRTKKDFESVDVDYFALEFPDILSYLGNSFS